MATNLFQMQNGRKSFGEKHLFVDACFAVNEGEHIAIIGPNGAGKSTLFKTLIDQEHLDSGEITRANGLRVGYLAQEDHWNVQDLAVDYLNKNSILPVWELKQLGLDLGLTEQMFNQPLSTLSGGFRMRFKLLALIGQKPDLMLLDEPTNFLDLESLVVLENFLQDYSNAFLLISHDREFLRRTTEYTLEIENGSLTKFAGNIDDYFEQKAMLKQILEQKAANNENKRKQIEAFVERFRAKATKAKQAQSRLKQLQKMEHIEVAKSGPLAKIHLPSPQKTSKGILTFSQVSLGYGQKVVLSNIHFCLERGDHLGVVGINGAGKSTFLKGLSGILKPITGTTEMGKGVEFAYYAQHLADTLLPQQTVLESLEAVTSIGITRQEVLNLAGSLLFSGDSVYKKIQVLSGGEKSRVALGRVLLQRAPCLLLDEPTNHLDFETVAALADALQNYEGTVVVVSHDRAFVQKVATKIVEIRSGMADYYPGTYDEYAWSVQKGVLSTRQQTPYQASNAEKGPSEKRADSSEKFNFKENKKNLEKQIRQLEKSIGARDIEIETLNKSILALTDRLMSSSGSDAQQIAKDLASTQLQVEALEEQVLTDMISLDNLKSELAKL